MLTLLNVLNVKASAHIEGVLAFSKTACALIQFVIAAFCFDIFDKQALQFVIRFFLMYL